MGQEMGIRVLPKSRDSNMEGLLSLPSPPLWGGGAGKSYFTCGPQIDGEQKSYNKDLKH